MEGGKLLHGFCQRVGGGVRLEGVRRKERQTKAEVGCREDSQGLDEDICCGLFTSKMRVELVSNSVQDSCQPP